MPPGSLSSHSLDNLDNLEGKQFSKDVIRGVTQETARDAHEWILICRNSIPLGLHFPGMTLL